ncbi:hypothetical protein Tco_0255037 [Tanacetum coccineum]
MELTSKAVEFKSMPAYVEIGKALKNGNNRFVFLLRDGYLTNFDVKGSKRWGCYYSAVLDGFFLDDTYECLFRQTESIRTPGTDFRDSVGQKRKRSGNFRRRQRNRCAGDSLMPHQMAYENMGWNSSWTDGGKVALEWVRDPPNYIILLFKTKHFLDVPDEILHDVGSPTDLELPNVILKRMYATIAKIREEDEEGTNSIENTSG